MKGSVSASRSSTRTRPAASSRWARPEARRMCSTSSHGVGHGGGPVPEPRARRASPGSRRATAPSTRTAPGERPMECHSTAIWWMRATWCFDVLVGMALPSRPCLPRFLPRRRDPFGGNLGVATILVGDSVPPMDIDEFYDADPRRRPSADLELASAWLPQDARGHGLNLPDDTRAPYGLRRAC